MFQLIVESGNSVECYSRASFADYGVHDPRLNLKNFITKWKYILINHKKVPQEQLAAKK